MGLMTTLLAADWSIPERIFYALFATIIICVLLTQVKDWFK